MKISHAEPLFSEVERSQRLYETSLVVPLLLQPWHGGWCPGNTEKDTHRGKEDER